MYGRCETDPFDQATDVCDSCYGEFCSACMVKTKGRKHPICKECAIIASGVRPGAKPLLRGSKKTASERRKTLKSAPDNPRPFEYFDDLEPAAAGDDPSAAAGPETDDEAERSDDDVAERPSDPQPAPVGAVEGAAASNDEPSDAPATIDPALPTAPTSRRPVTPALAALAQHQADKRGPDTELEPVPAPAWLTGSDHHPDTTSTADHPDGTWPAPAQQPPEAITANTEVPTGDAEHVRPERRADEKPVTEGFDWVTQLPARGSSTPLPSRSGRTTGNGADPAPAAATAPAGGAVATADRPPPGLPRRRSKLRPSDGDG